MKVKQKIELISKLLNFASTNNNHSDLEDIRSITLDTIAQGIQNYLIALKLSEHLNDINYVKEKIWKDFVKDDLKVVNYNFNGYIKDAFFNSLFISVESNFRTVAKHFEATEGQINNTSIKTTFTNLLSIISFFTSITSYEKDVITYFLYLRNTVHNFGIHTKPSYTLEIEDATSVINQSKVKLELIQNKTNNISSENLYLLFEQVMKAVIKFNSLIPSTENIKHPLVDFGYNN